ncbi:MULTISPECIES: cytochrome P450 [Amycolatopsis]|uniref:Cytochrome P450 n=1 Tax=Amycolatopsis albidoflavus TaxID=102226 RepID=A0ABW5I7Q5_9PSEU
MRTKLDGIDLWNPDNYVSGVPYEMFARLRAEAPVYWHEEPGGPGFWVITKHADVRAISRDWATFSSELGGTEIADYPEAELAGLRLLLLYMDPDRHTRYRLLVNKAFTPRRVQALAQRIEQLSARIVDEVAELGGCDFVADLAAQLPLRVIAELIGIPEPDRPFVFDLANRIIGWMDPELSSQRSDATAASVEMLQYAAKLAEVKRSDPGDDITSALVHISLEDESGVHRLSELEIGLFFLLLAIAGNETTRNLLSQGMLAFFEHPGEWARLRANPTLMDGAIEEMLRWGTPTMHFRRTATRDTVVRDVLIREGEKVSVWYISANRDEEVFADPCRFDITRSPNDHLAFGGGGPHFCFGSHLAKIEISAFFGQLLRRLPDIRLDGEVDRLRSNFANAVKRMPVAFAPTRVAARIGPGSTR